MPELPEVETVVRGLTPFIQGATVKRVLLKRKDLRFPFPPRFATLLQGASILRIGRRAKYLLFSLSNGKILLVHLGMSGRLRFESGQTSSPGDFYDDSPANTRHDHAIFELKPHGRLVYNDARRFGFMELLPAAELDQRFADLGIEPLSNAFNAKTLLKLLKNKKTAIKTALLDQRLIAGIGNIYACEALFEARISPKKPAGRITAQEASCLALAIKKVLKKAIRYGGSTLRDFKDAEGRNGRFQNEFKAYDRMGQPCPWCRAPIKRLTQTGRSTFYCPICQR